ncbi:hypothetical protein IG7_00773 [Bacillus cereus HuA2-4]|nr:hypothetical protein IG7_00773 [Bacillus cereus HuA2-4]
MTVNRKLIPDGLKYYITCKDKKGQKYYRYNHAPSWEYPDGRIEDTTTFTEISDNFKEEVLNAMESSTDAAMQTGPHAEPAEVDPHQIDLTTVVIENYNPNRIFAYFE